MATFRLRAMREWQSSPTGIKVTRLRDGVQVSTGSRFQVNRAVMLPTKEVLKLAARWAEPGIPSTVIITCKDGRVTTVETDPNGIVTVTEKKFELTQHENTRSNSAENALLPETKIVLDNIAPALSKRKARKLASIYRGSSRGVRYIQYLHGECNGFYVSHNRLKKINK